MAFLIGLKQTLRVTQDFSSCGVVNPFTKVYIKMHLSKRLSFLLILNTY